MPISFTNPEKAPAVAMRLPTRTHKRQGARHNPARSFHPNLKEPMNRLHALLALFLLSAALCGCRSRKEETENHCMQLLQTLVTDDTVMKAEKSEVAAIPTTERLCNDVKRLSARLLDAGKGKELEEMLRPVAECLQEHGMSDAAAVTAAACMGIDADPAHPGPIAHRLLTRLLLVGKKAPRLSRTAPSVSAGPTLLVFYQTECEECESVLRDLCGFYATLKGRGVRVVSVSCDEDEHVFSSRAASLPWATKWRDSRGFQCPDFEAYGVAFTPSLVVVNPDGRVAGSYSTLEETGLIRSFY